jgi:hypothetical protein
MLKSEVDLTPSKVLKTLIEHIPGIAFNHHDQALIGLLCKINGIEHARPHSGLRQSSNRTDFPIIKSNHVRDSREIVNLPDTLSQGHKGAGYLTQINNRVKPL